ncbi:hypothetical protein CR513_02461, partial [Mucuna pruriens]
MQTSACAQVRTKDDKVGGFGSDSSTTSHLDKTLFFIFSKSPRVSRNVARTVSSSLAAEVLSKRGFNSGTKHGDGVSSLVWHRKAQALVKRIEDFPSRTAWWMLMPMLNPLFGKRVIWIEITEA